MLGIHFLDKKWSTCNVISPNSINLSILTQISKIHKSSLTSHEGYFNGCKGPNKSHFYFYCELLTILKFKPL